MYDRATALISSALLSSAAMAGGPLYPPAGLDLSATDARRAPAMIFPVQQRRLA